MTRALLFAFVAVTSLGCSNGQPIDDDGDGWAPPADCDDARADVYTGRDEIPYDGVDQDCSGSDLVDRDGDAFEGDEDCDDLRADVRPTGVDVCGDGVDQDCSGEDLACTDADRDRDGFSPNEGDCNDDDPRINPRAREIPYDGVDQDCDLETPDDDLDGDGFGVRSDCDDEDPRVYPGALDPTGDGIDADCDGNEAESDYDRDGHAAAPEGDDCDDFDAYVNPSRVDVPGDGLDADCDGRDELGTPITLGGERIRFVHAFDDRVAVVSGWDSSSELMRIDLASRDIVRRRFGVTETVRVAVLHGQVWVAVRGSSSLRIERWLASDELVAVASIPSTSPYDRLELLPCDDVVLAVVALHADRTLVLRVGPESTTTVGESPRGFDQAVCADGGVVLFSAVDRVVSWFDLTGAMTSRTLPEGEVPASHYELVAADARFAWIRAAGQVTRAPRDGGASPSYSIPYDRWRWLGAREVYFEQDGVWWQARTVDDDFGGVMELRDERPVLGAFEVRSTSAHNGRWLAVADDRIYLPAPYLL